MGGVSVKEVSLNLRYAALVVLNTSVPCDPTLSLIDQPENALFLPLYKAVTVKLDLGELKATVVAPVPEPLMVALGPG